MLLYARMHLALATKRCNLRITQVIVVLKTWRDHGRQLRFANMAGLEFVKGVRLQWWILAVSEMLVSYSHQKHQSQWNGGRLRSRREIMYILLRGWPKRFGDTRLSINPKESWMNPRYWALNSLYYWSLGVVMLIRVVPVLYLWSKNKSTCLILLEHTLERF